MEALWDQEALADNAFRVLKPVFAPIWRNHDIYLRWAGRSVTETHVVFNDQAVLEIAVDTYVSGSEAAFLAAASPSADQEYALHPNHTYLLMIEIGAATFQKETRCYRITLLPGHLRAGILNRRRLELEEVSHKAFESARRKTVAAAK